MKRATDVAHEWIRERLTPGDTAIDATAGNGHDTLFLAELVGKTGKVIAFDVQQAAIDTTLEKLQTADCAGQTQLVLAGHETMAHHAGKGEVSVIMFNLGYLPGSDKAQITQPGTTIEALKSAFGLLRVGGIVTVILYTGHEGGNDEAEAVLKLCSELNPKDYRATRCDSLNFAKRPPFLVAIERNR